MINSYKFLLQFLSLFFGGSNPPLSYTYISIYDIYIYRIWYDMTWHDMIQYMYIYYVHTWYMYMTYYVYTWYMSMTFIYVYIYNTYIMIFIYIVYTCTCILFSTIKSPTPPWRQMLASDLQLDFCISSLPRRSRWAAEAPVTGSHGP